ncbi:MAG: shikimate kinase [Clostridia bacterium]|nr:shikimate kinase [Clostridia bacterium]
MIKLQKPIVLCGFMASGKSTIGKLASAQWHYPFYDTDTMIITRAGKTIPQIFAAEGEQGFRDLEHEICREIVGLLPCIISSGGGLLTFARNGDLLQGRATIILLSRDFDLTWEYLAGCQDRPMLRGKTKEEIRSLYLARIPLYRKYADYEIENNGSPETCLKKLGDLFTR